MKRVSLAALLGITTNGNHQVAAIRTEAVWSRIRPNIRMIRNESWFIAVKWSPVTGADAESGCLLWRTLSDFRKAEFKRSGKFILGSIQKLVNMPSVLYELTLGFSGWKQKDEQKIQLVAFQLQKETSMKLPVGTVPVQRCSMNKFYLLCRIYIVDSPIESIHLFKK